MCSLLRCTRARAQFRDARGRGRSRGVAARYWPPHANALHRLRARNHCAHIASPPLFQRRTKKTRILVRARLSETLASKNCRMHITRNSKKRCWTAAFYSGFIFMSLTSGARARRGAAAGSSATALSRAAQKLISVGR